MSRGPFKSLLSFGLMIAALFLVSGPAQAGKTFTIPEIQVICEKGNVRACSSLAYAYESGKIAGGLNLKLSEKYYIKTCELKDYQSCMNLANNYMSKKFPTKNIMGTAFKYYKKSCSGKIESACSYYGSLMNKMANGQKEAAWAYGRACTLGAASSCYEAGKIYQRGKGKIDRQGGGVEKNILVASFYFKKACTGGVKKACR